MENLSESLFESIDLIIKNRLNEIKYDRTIICKIVSPKNIDYYYVTDGSSNFKAYSEKDYNFGEYVNVLIPEGDFSRTKVIISKSY